MPAIEAIVNPASANGRTGKHWPELRARLEARGFTVNAQMTTARGDASCIARRLVEAGADEIVVVGGDGTLNEVANGLLGLGPQAPRPAHPWRALRSMPLAVWVGVLVMFFINALNGITNTFQPLIATRAGLSLTQIGALSSIRSWASSSSRFGSGPLFSRFDPAGLTLPLVVAGTLATCAIPSVIGSFLLQIPLFAVAGLSRGLLRVTGSADAFDAVGDDERRHGLTAALLSGGLDVGKIAGPVVGGVVAGVWSIETMFRVVPIALLVLYLALAIPARRRYRAATPTGQETPVPARPQ